jgi:hypothetical protein
MSARWSVMSEVDLAGAASMAWGASSMTWHASKARLSSRDSSSRTIVVLLSMELA